MESKSNSLEIGGLSVSVSKKEILKSISISIKKGERVVLLGPNGSGKSTLLKSIIGFDDAKLITGNIYVNGRDVSKLNMEERIESGLSISYQNPPKIKGVKLIDLLNQITINEQQIKDYSKKLKLTQHLNKEINVNFSGGEMKRSEVLQILLQNKNLLLLDEVDAGLDIENLKLIGQILEEYLSREKTALIVTHTGQILKYINANRFLLLLEGKLYEIPRNYPGKEILKNIAIKGYKKFVSSLK